MITGIILVLAFLHFFPQYAVKTNWDKILLGEKVRDTLNTIDRLDKTYELAINPIAFNTFMENLFQPEQINVTMIWWSEVDGLEVTNPSIPFYAEGFTESMVDVVKTASGYKVYSFTLGLGYPY